MNKKFLLATLMCLGFMTSKAQIKHLKNIEEAKALSDKCTRLFKENKITESFSEMEKYWPLPVNEIDELEDKSIKYLHVLTERYGDLIGYVKIKDEVIKDFAYKETYFIRFSYSAIRMEYIYYKNNEGWILNSFTWDDAFINEFIKQ